MTKFTKATLSKDGEYLFYIVNNQRKFVARFKYQKGGIGSFTNFLIKHFTVEEYFSAIDAGATPLGLLQSKGYLQPHIKKWLKRDGYDVSIDGFNQYIQDKRKV